MFKSSESSLNAKSPSTSQKGNNKNGSSKSTGTKVPNRIFVAGIDSNVSWIHQLYEIYINSVCKL